MKKLFTFVFCAFLALPAFSKVIMTESFDRNVGNLHSGTSGNEGTDKKNWWNVTGSSNLILVADTNLTYTGYCAEAIGKAARYQSSSCMDFRQFDAVNSGSVYMSALINIHKVNSEKVGTALAFASDKSSSKQYGRLIIKTVEGGYQLGVAKYTESTNYMRYSKTLELNKTYLIVLRYDFVSGDNNDEAYLWINPLPSSESAPSIRYTQDTTSSTGNPLGASKCADPASLSNIQVASGTNCPPRMTLDEIKVATTWADLEISDGETPIVKPELEVNPSSLDFGKYISGQTYSKTFTVTGSNLTNDISIGFKSTTTNISINPTSISKDNENLASGVTVTVTIEKERKYDIPTGTTIVVSSGDLSKNVSIKGTEQVITYQNVENFNYFYSDPAPATEDVIFTYTGTTAKISSINEGYKQLTLKDVSNKTINVQIAEENWENLNPVIDMKINELIFTAEKKINPFSGTTAITAYPTTITFKGADFEREVTSLNIGTICLKGMVQTSMLETVDATFYKILYKEGDPNAPTNIVFEEVTELEENIPYIFQPNSIGTMKFYTHNANTNTPGNMNGLYGTFEYMTIEAGLYLISNNMICKAGTGCDLAANRAYINMSQVPTEEEGKPKGVPGVKKISLKNPDGYAAPTGCQNIKAGTPYRKAMIDGKVVIMSNGKKMNILGQTIK